MVQPSRWRVARVAANQIRGLVDRGRTKARREAEGAGSERGRGRWRGAGACRARKCGRGWWRVRSGRRRRAIPWRVTPHSRQRRVARRREDSLRRSVRRREECCGRPFQCGFLWFRQNRSLCRAPQRFQRSGARAGRQFLTSSSSLPRSGREARRIHRAGFRKLRGAGR